VFRVLHSTQTMLPLQTQNIDLEVSTDYLTIAFTGPNRFVQALLLSKGHAVAQLVEARRYASEGRGFSSQLCHWNFSLT
jgi:hypothetical protein